MHQCKWQNFKALSGFESSLLELLGSRSSIYFASGTSVWGGQFPRISPGNRNLWFHITKAHDMIWIEQLMIWKCFSGSVPPVSQQFPSSFPPGRHAHRPYGFQADGAFHVGLLDGLGMGLLGWWHETNVMIAGSFPKIPCVKRISKYVYLPRSPKKKHDPRSSDFDRHSSLVLMTKNTHERLTSNVDFWFEVWTSMIVEQSWSIRPNGAMVFPNDGTTGNLNSDLEQSEEDKHHIINIVFLKWRIPKSLSHHVFFTGKSNLEDLGGYPHDLGNLHVKCNQHINSHQSGFHNHHWFQDISRSPAVLQSARFFWGATPSREFRALLRTTLIEAMRGSSGCGENLQINSWGMHQGNSSTSLWMITQPGYD